MSSGELHAYRQFFAVDFRKTSRDRKSGQARKVGSNGKDILQIHRHRIGGFFAYFKSWGRRRRRQNDVNGFKSFDKVVGDDATCGICAIIVCVIVAG